MAAANKGTLQVAASVYKGIMATAKGPPATVHAIGVAAGIAAIGAGIGYGAYRGGAWAARRLRGGDLPDDQPLPSDGEA